MDTSSAYAIPRLRLPRNTSQYQNHNLSPVAGPSHNPDLLSADDDDEDAESTPRMSSSAIPDKNSPRAMAAPGLPADNPTARLRALLARVPNSSNGNTPLASMSRPLAPLYGSEPESDFEPPLSVVATPASSFARESLKELFSQALREPGNTPRKNGRPRRNSIDTSEVEASPRVEEQRARYKSKRRTLSDEEADKSRHTDSSEPSVRSSAASTFDALRQRLNRSSTVMPSPPRERMVMDMSLPPANSSTDTAMQPPMPIETPADTPPRASSTPMHTFQISQAMDMDTDLLEHDSEMQNVLQGMDSFEGSSVPRHRHNSTPSSRSLKTSVGPTPRPPAISGSSARPLSWSSHSKSHSTHNLPLVRRGSEDLDTSSSRASSSLSNVDYHERVDETNREKLHERERGWNSPAHKQVKSHANPGKHDGTHRHSWGSPSNGRSSPAHALSRKSSAASLTSVTSTDDGRPSSRASSVASRSEYNERNREFEGERNKEREREWNKPHHKLTRSSSSLSLNKNERTRNISTPSRPESATSYLSPVTNTLHRHGSLSPLSSSRPGSPTGSISAHDVEEVIEHEFEHQRERNWNSPRPDWGNPLHHRRSLSPLPHSRAGSPTGTPPHGHPTTPRSRTNSITRGNSLSVPSSIPRSKSPAGERVPRPRSPLPSVDKSTSSQRRSKSPVPPTPPPGKAETSTPSYRSHFGWQFPQHKSLPPLELEHESPQRSPPRSPSRNSLIAPATPSHIPVRSNRKSISSTPSGTSASASERKKSHRRSITEFAESIGPIPVSIVVSESDDLAPIPLVDGHDDYSSASEDEVKHVKSTPTAKPVTLPQPEFSTSPMSEPPISARNGYAMPVQTQETQPRPQSPLASPPLTPPAADSQPGFTLQTPPHRQFITSKEVFETPPPPSGMPDLPGPPSDEEDGEDNHRPLMSTPVITQGDLTAMKTPRPPGAWYATPAPTRQSTRDAVERTVPAPAPDFNTSSSDSGLATPPSTLSRASTVPPQTPAPPGGWVATPAPGTTGRRRGSIMKVRFDLKSETGSEGAVDSPSADGSMESRDAQGCHPNGDASTSSSAPPEESLEPPPTPPSLRDRIRKMSPGVRIMDAYGREKVEPEEPAELPEALPVDFRPALSSTPRRNDRPASNTTPRNRSAVRVVDAMGREIEEEPVKEEDSILSQTPLSHNEALSRIRDTVSCMRQELSDADRSSDDAVFDPRTFAALQEQCKTAQLARSKISQSLQMAQSQKGEVKDKYAPLRDQGARSALLPSSGVDVQLTWNMLSWRFLASFVVVQLLLLAIMYRYSLVQARKIFLTTYYDSFSPELYIYLLKPDTTNYTIPSCPSWSIFTIFDSLHTAGWRGVLADTWASASCAVSSYFQSAWVGWHYAQDTVTHSWPPT